MSSTEETVLSTAEKAGILAGNNGRDFTNFFLVMSRLGGVFVSKSDSKKDYYFRFPDNSRIDVSENILWTVQASGASTCVSD